MLITVNYRPNSVCGGERKGSEIAAAAAAAAIPNRCRCFCTTAADATPQQPAAAAVCLLMSAAGLIVFAREAKCRKTADSNNQYI